MGRMARTPDGVTARTEKTTVRHTKSWGAVLDRKRGSLSRSEYLRRLVMGAPEPTGEQR